ncbi:hypothetical protein DL96DRAFT_185903 [Flagelloscypha sp. PMI_526]|nr:hypothetical protein DL96DRAFT_185903 [Flagelloscypha sp. PMI_526]
MYLSSPARLRRCYDSFCHFLSKASRGAIAAFCFVLSHWTILPLLQNLIEKPHLQHEDIRYCSETLNARSKIITNVQLALIALTSTSIIRTPSNVIAAFIVLFWCMINRAYYESLPLDELQSRIQSSTPALVAVLYAIPEIYQVYFIVSHVVASVGWVSALAICFVCVFRLAIQRFARFQCHKRSLLPC